MTLNYLLLFCVFALIIDVNVAERRRASDKHRLPFVARVRNDSREPLSNIGPTVHALMSQKVILFKKQ
jgi:hypothetical protein